MAERRMFAKSIVLSDAFLDMPMSARCLYFTLGMVADDRGFIGNPKSVMRQCGASQDDMSILLNKRFLLIHDSGVVTIKHWEINNYIRNDRFHETVYLEEKNSLILKDNGSYTERLTGGIPSDNQVVYQMDTEVSIGKDSIGKFSIGERNTAAAHGKHNNVFLSNEEFEKLAIDFPNYRERIDRLSEYMYQTGKTYKHHYDVICKWAKEDEGKKPEAKRSYDINQVGKHSILERLKEVE